MPDFNDARVWKLEDLQQLIAWTRRLVEIADRSYQRQEYLETMFALRQLLARIG